MSELARRRRARDLWISRSHLRAAAMLVLVTSAACFLAGYVVGHGRVTEEPPPSQDDEALIDLLSRIEANTRPDAEVEELKYGDSLRSGVTGVPAASPAPRPVTEIAPTTGSFTVVVAEGDQPTVRGVEQGLRSAGVLAEVRSPVGEGQPWRATVGAWPTAAGAAVGVAVVKAAGYDGRVSPLP